MIMKIFCLKLQKADMQSHVQSLLADRFDCSGLSMQE